MPISLQLHKGSAIEVRGYIGSGKSQLLYHLAVDHSLRGQRVQFWTSDMEADQLFKRLCSFGSGDIDVQEIRGEVASRLTPGVDVILVDDVDSIPTAPIAEEVENITRAARSMEAALVMTLRMRHLTKPPNLPDTSKFFDESWWFFTNNHIECLRGGDTTQRLYVEPFSLTPES